MKMRTLKLPVGMLICARLQISTNFKLVNAGQYACFAMYASLQLRLISYFCYTWLLLFSASYSFVIKCSERNLMLRAQNTSDMEKWLRILRQSTSYAQGGNGTSCDFSKTGAGAGARAKAASSKACNSLASELDKALDGLNRLEADAMEKEHEAVRMDISNRINANANASIAAAGARESFAPVRPEGGQIIRSSDSEICIGKMHAPLPNEHNNKNVHNNTQFSSDQEIVVGKTSPISPNNEMNNSSISYFGDDDDGADDGVVEFDELPDEEEFRYQEKLLAEKYGSELISKGDQVSSATATGTESRDAKVDRRQTPPASMSVSRAECKRKDWDSGRLDSKGYESK